MKYNELLEKYKILEEENRILKEEIKQLKMKSVAEPPYTGIKRCQEPRPVDNLPQRRSENYEIERQYRH
jgi:hypothetical protein